MDMVRAGDFPDRTLFCGDAGFIGYPLWSCILHGGFQFLVRVGANVSLLAESAEFQPQQDGLVLCWPKAMRQAGQPPLRLRLVKVPLGKTTAWLLTSILDPRELTVRQMVRLYKMRWGVEVEFRGLKQTLHRAKLRCRNDRRLLAELDWSILAMAIAELFALNAQLSKQERRKSRKKPPPPDPAKRSLAKTLRALRHCLRNFDEIPAPDDDLGARLRAAVTDSYQRKASKGARYRPPNPDKKPLGDPELRTMTAQERQKLENIAA